MKISSFQGQYRFLSNFWTVDVRLDNQVYTTVEHAYQAAKTDSISERTNIQACISPGYAKRLGRTLTMRKDWDEVKLSIMRDLLQQKFERPDLLKLLKATGAVILEEGNTWGDTYWGVCNGVGENNLGKLLMFIRSKL